VGGEVEVRRMRWWGSLERRWERGEEEEEALLM